MTDIVERLRSLAAVDNCQTSLEAADASAYQYRVVFKPSAIVPDVEVR